MKYWEHSNDDPPYWFGNSMGQMMDPITRPIRLMTPGKWWSSTQWWKDHQGQRGIQRSYNSKEFVNREIAQSQIPSFWDITSVSILRGFPTIHHFEWDYTFLCSLPAHIVSASLIYTSSAPYSGVTCTTSPASGFSFGAEMYFLDGPQKEKLPQSLSHCRQMWFTNSFELQRYNLWLSCFHISEITRWWPSPFIYQG